MIPFYARLEDIKEDEILANSTRKNELIKILIQTLENLGYEKASQNLIKESGVDLENENLKLFRNEIKKGDWDKALEEVPKLNLTTPGTNEANLLIYEQKYLELIEQKKILEALEVLRLNIKPFIENTEKLHKLASLIMCQNSEELYEKSGISNGTEAKKQLLMNIRSKCKPESMIEPNRFENLLSQALTYQMISCKYHSANINDVQQFSLIEQHKCQCEETPNVCNKTIKDKDEVWNLKFSPDGEKIASVCKKSSLAVWDFNLNNKNLIQSKFTLEKVHSSEINSLCWSPDSTKLSTSSSDKLIKIHNASTGQLINTLSGHKEAVFGAIWHPDNQRIISGGIDSDLIIWKESSGEIISRINFNRISELLISPNGKFLYCICASLCKISVFDIQKQTEINKISEKDDILSAQISADGNFLLVNTSHKNPELHLWDLKTFEMVMRYTGHSQEKFLIRCDFGGPNDCFITCGSEDSKIYIWHKNLQKPIKILSEHKSSVNAVSWNRKNPHILISGSDDQTIKLWVTAKIDKNAKDPKTFIKKVKNIVKSLFQSVEDKKNEANEKAFEKGHQNQELGNGLNEDYEENDG